MEMKTTLCNPFVVNGFKDKTCKKPSHIWAIACFQSVLMATDGRPIYRFYIETRWWNYLDFGTQKSRGRPHTIC